MNSELEKIKQIMGYIIVVKESKEKARERYYNYSFKCDQEEVEACLNECFELDALQEKLRSAKDEVFNNYELLFNNYKLHLLEGKLESARAEIGNDLHTKEPVESAPAPPDVAENETNEVPDTTDAETGDLGLVTKGPTVVIK